MMPSAAAPVTKPVSAKFEQALEQLESLCAALQPGDRIPALPELMRRFQASERAVLRSLDELQRQGRVIRRHGAGTFVAEPTAAFAAPLSLVDQPSIIAVRMPDNSYFDRCVDLLFPHTEALRLPLICRIVGPQTGPEAAETLVPSGSEKQLSFILFRYDLAPLAKKIQDKGCRVVIVGAPPVDVTPEVPCVYSDHQEGGYLITRHLLTLGHRRIGYHASRVDYTQNLRWRGHQRAIEEVRRGAAPVLDSVISDSELIAWRTDPDRVKSFFRTAEAPTAIVAWNDHEAVRLVVALTAAGIRVPEDVSVTGYDNLPEGQIVHPPLSTVDHAMDWQIRTALDLLRRPTLPTPSHTMTVLPTLVPRGSTAPVA